MSQRTRAPRRTPTPDITDAFLLLGRIVCGVCATQLQSHASARDGLTYRCTAPGCPRRPSVTIREINAEALAIAGLLVSSDQVVARVVDHLISPTDRAKAAEACTRCTAIADRIANLERAATAIGRWSPSLSARRDALLVDLQAAEQIRTEADAALAAARDEERLVRTAHDLARAGQPLTLLAFNERRDLLAHLGVRAVVYGRQLSDRRAPRYVIESPEWILDHIPSSGRNDGSML